MYFLKKGTLEFDKIKENGYEINEQPNLIAKKQFVNGNRKKIVTNYTDVVITINLSGLNYDDLDTYLTELVDGEYEYYSLVDNDYKSANFIVTIPPLTVKKSISETEYYIGDLSIILEKSSNVTDEGSTSI